MYVNCWGYSPRRADMADSVIDSHGLTFLLANLSAVDHWLIYGSNGKLAQGDAGGQSRQLHRKRRSKHSHQPQR